LASANHLLRRIAALFNEKDGTDDGKRMASNWEVILTPFLRFKAGNKFSRPWHWAVALNQVPLLTAYCPMPLTLGLGEA